MKFTLEEYRVWISREIEKSLRPTRSKGARLIDEARRALEDAKRFFDDLVRKGERDMATKKDPASYRAARVIAHSAREALHSLAQVQGPGEVNWESLRGLRDALSAQSHSLRGIRNRSSGELAGLYILDMRSFSGFLDRFTKLSERLSSFLDGEGSALQKARGLTSVLTSIHDLRKELNEKEQEAEKLARDQEVLSSHIDGLSLELDKLSRKNGLSEILEIEKELRKESRDFGATSLAHLQRPLRKLRDLSQRGDIPLSPEEKMALDEYIRSPYKSFLREATGPHLEKILAGLHVVVKSGRMEFKPRKMARVLTQLDQLTATEHLDAIRRKGRGLLTRRRKLLQSSDTKQVYRERRDIIRKIEELRAQQDSARNRARTLQEKSITIHNRLGELLSVAEAKTKEYIGREVQIGGRE